MRRKSLEVPELDAQNVSINGILDESVWASSAHYGIGTIFSRSHASNRRHTQRCTYFLYPGGHLFWGTFQDNRATILSQLTPRDRINANTDWIHIILNPFNDGANDFNFYLSAGVQGDSRATSSNDEDGSWNAVWWSAVIEEHRWSFEMYIPYQVLRIPQGGAVAKHPLGIQHKA